MAVLGERRLAQSSKHVICYGTHTKCNEMSAMDYQASVKRRLLGNEFNSPDVCFK